MSTPADGGSFSFYVGGGTSFPVYDLNGDGIPEMVLQYGKHTIRFLRADTGEDETSWSYPGTTFSNTQSPMTPVVADVDGSGHASVVWYHDVNLNGTSFLQVLRGDTMPWRSAPAHVNQWAYWETNFNDDGSVPQTYVRHTTDPRTDVLNQQPPAPYAPNFIPSEQTVFTYRAMNTQGAQSSPAKATISLIPHNRTPAFVSKPPKFWATFTVDYLAQAVDPDLGDVITYALVWSDTAVVVNPVTGLVHFNSLFNGEPSALISATDNHGAIGYQSFTMRPAAGTTAVPDVVGMMQAGGEATLMAALLSVGDVVQQYNSGVAGRIIAQFPTVGTSLPYGESVDLTVSLGPTPIPVPNVVGTAKTVATSSLVAKGFTVQLLSVFSNAAAGMVIAQQPGAGAMLQPGVTPVALTVSAGNGLTLALTRSITTADQTIDILPAAFDVNGQPTALPALTYQIAPKQTPFSGALPGVAGTTITPGAGSLGAFTVTATDTVNARSASAEFAVLPPRVAGATTNGEVYAHMTEALDAMFGLRQGLRAARDANNIAQMTTLLQQFVTIWRTVDLDDLRISQPLVTASQFAPTLDMIAASPTADDLLSHQVLQDAIADLTAWTAALKNGGVTLNQLDALADQFSSRAARLESLTISRWGGINNVPQYTRLMSHAIPAFYEALSEQLAELTGMAPRAPAFPFAAALNGGAAPGPRIIMTLASASPEAAFAGGSGSLAELAVTVAVDYVVEKIMEAGAKVYANAKQFAVDVMQQSAYTAAAVAAANELRAFVQGQDVYEVVSGASLSFREFQSAPAWVEAPGDIDPTNNIVLFVGPDLFTKAKANGIDFLKKLATGYNFHLNPLTNPEHYVNADQIRADLGKFKEIAKQALGDLGALIREQATRLFQSPGEVLAGCAFTSDPACRQLIYPNGIEPVWTYSPPPGFESLGGLPVPIVTIVYNGATGVMYFGTPPFLPCKIDTSVTPNQVQCPNNPPFTP